MRSIEYTDRNGIEWERVTKTAARKMFDAGETVAIAGCNANPCSVWFQLACVARDSVQVTFDAAVNRYAYYLPRELGAYPAYYVKK